MNNNIEYSSVSEVNRYLSYKFESDALLQKQPAGLHLQAGEQNHVCGGPVHAQDLLSAGKPGK